MKYTLIITLAFSLSFPAYAVKETNQQLQEIRSLITETIASIKTSPFSHAQKQILHSKLSTVQKQHEALTVSLQKTESEQPEAVLKSLHEQALAQHKETLRTIEEVERQDAKWCFFEPSDPLVASAKAAVINSIKTHEKILSDYPY